MASLYYRSLSGHAASGSYLCDKIGKIASSECWCCRSGERQSSFHLIVRCIAWDSQARKMWVRIGKAYGIGKACGWKHPRAPSAKKTFEDKRATEAVLTYLRDTRAGYMVSLVPLEEEGGPGLPQDEEGEGGGPGPL